MENWKDVKARLRELGFRNYEAYLRSEHWRQLRSAVFKQNKTCFCCGIESRNPELHHVRYDNIGNEKPEDVVVVCKYCHDKLHGRHDDGKVSLWDAHLQVRELNILEHRFNGHVNASEMKKILAKWDRVGDRFTRRRVRNQPKGEQSP